MHQCIDGTARYKVYMGAVLVPVPYILYPAINGRIDIKEFLKFIYYQVEGEMPAQTHQHLEQACKRSHFGRNIRVQCLGGCLSELGAQRCFVASAHKKIYVLQFWYRFIYPNLDLVENYRSDLLLDIVRIRI